MDIVRVTEGAFTKQCVDYALQNSLVHPVRVVSFMDDAKEVAHNMLIRGGRVTEERSQEVVKQLQFYSDLGLQILSKKVVALGAELLGDQDFMHFYNAGVQYVIGLRDLMLQWFQKVSFSDVNFATFKEQALISPVKKSPITGSGIEADDMLRLDVLLLSENDTFLPYLASEQNIRTLQSSIKEMQYLNEFFTHYLGEYWPKKLFSFYQVVPRVYHDELKYKVTLWIFVNTMMCQFILSGKPELKVLSESEVRRFAAVEALSPDQVSQLGGDDTKYALALIDNRKDWEEEFDAWLAGLDLDDSLKEIFRESKELFWSDFHSEAVLLGNNSFAVFHRKCTIALLELYVQYKQLDVDEFYFRDTFNKSVFSEQVLLLESIPSYEELTDLFFVLTEGYRNPKGREQIARLIAECLFIKMTAKEFWKFFQSLVDSFDVTQRSFGFFTNVKTLDFQGLDWSTFKNSEEAADCLRDEWARGFSNCFIAETLIAISKTTSRKKAAFRKRLGFLLAPEIKEFQIVYPGLYPPKKRKA